MAQTVVTTATRAAIRIGVETLGAMPCCGIRRKFATDSVVNFHCVLTQELNRDSLLRRMAYRPTERTEQRKAEARERIVAAALDQLAEGGYASATIQAVAKRAGVATGTVYRHF